MLTITPVIYTMYVFWICLLLSRPYILWQAVPILYYPEMLNDLLLTTSLQCSFWILKQCPLVDLLALWEKKWSCGCPVQLVRAWSGGLRSCLLFFFCRTESSGIQSLFWYGRSLISRTNLVALLCTLSIFFASSLPVYLLCQRILPYSRCGLIRVLNRIGSVVFSVARSSFFSLFQ